MDRTDSNVFLLYIEPNKEEKLEYPVNDFYTRLMQKALDRSISGSSNYNKIDEIPHWYNSGFRGRYITDCGKMSSNNDYLLENGMITNSLCVFYLTHYRNSIPQSEWDKIHELAKFYTQLGDENVTIGKRLTSLDIKNKELK